MAALHQTFGENARKFPRRAAILTHAEIVRYGELHARATALARAFAACDDLAPGDRVAILAGNSPAYIAVLYGLFAAGLVAVPLNTFLKPTELDYILRDCGARRLIHDDASAETVAGLAARPDGPTLVPFTGGPGSIEALGADTEGARDSALPEVTADSVAQIIYTSGTTGRPKGVMLTHRNLAANVESCRELVGALPSDRFSLVLPAFHSFTLTVCVHTPLALGSGIVMARSLSPFRPVLKMLIHRRTTILVGVPQIFRALSLARLPLWVPWVLRVRLALCGGAPLDRETAARFARGFRFPLIEGYGLTEAAPVVAIGPLDGRPSPPGTVGVALPGVAVEIHDPDGARLPTGGVGEIVVRGDNVMLGYLNRPEETAAALRDGWLRTGDLGRLDAGGFLRVEGRIKELILVNGMNVYPREIEDVLSEHPAVGEAAVVGVTDGRRGEAPAAFIEPAPGVEPPAPDDLRAWCRERLADYKLPRTFRVVDSLPRTATGKIAKRNLVHDREDPPPR